MTRPMRNPVRAPVEPRRPAVAFPLAAWITGVVLMAMAVGAVILGDPAPESAGTWSAAGVAVWASVACMVIGVFAAVVVGLRPPRWHRLVVVGLIANLFSLTAFVLFLAWTLSTLSSAG